MKKAIKSEFFMKNNLLLILALFFTATLYTMHHNFDFDLEAGNDNSERIHLMDEDAPIFIHHSRFPFRVNSFKKCALFSLLVSATSGFCLCLYTALPEIIRQAGMPCSSCAPVITFLQDTRNSQHHLFLGIQCEYTYSLERQVYPELNLNLTNRSVPTLSNGLANLCPQDYDCVVEEQSEEGLLKKGRCFVVK